MTKIHFDTEQASAYPRERWSLCQRCIHQDHLARDPSAVTCYQCRVRMHDKNVYWRECRPKEAKE